MATTSSRRQFNDVLVGGRDYEAVAASQSDQVLGTAGAAGDVLGRLVINVTTTLAAAVTIKDGSSGAAITVAPVGTPVGVHTVELGIRSVNGGWRVTTPANCSVLAIGSFSV